MTKHQLDIDVFDDALEFTFDGRDLSNKIVEAFVEIASIVRDASGEIRCEIEDEERDPRFMFYSVSHSQLWVQPAEIVRASPKVRVS